MQFVEAHGARIPIVGFGSMRLKPTIGMRAPCASTNCMKAFSGGSKDYHIRHRPAESSAAVL